MKALPLLIASTLLGAVGCDLAELNRKPEAGVSTADAAPPGDALAAPDAPPPTDGPIVDAPPASDDGAIPPGSPLGSCDPAT